MKKISKILLGALAGSFLFVNVASAINLPEYMEFDGGIRQRSEVGKR